MNFRVIGLPSQPFRHLYGMTDDELANQGARRYIADRLPGFPDRIEVRDAQPGETLLLLNFVHQPAATPYQASHAIFVREGADETYDRVGEVPEAMRIRPISLRAFDSADLMVDADLVDGRDLEGLIARFFENPEVSYMHAHYAKRGCYAARVERA